MADVARLGIVIDSKGVPVANKRLQKLTKTSGGAVTATSKLSMAWGVLGKLFVTGAVIQGFRKIINATVTAERSIAQLEAGLASTGGVSGQTMRSLQALADEMQRTTIYGDELVESAEAILLSFTEISGEAFPATIRAAADLSSRMGTDLQSSIVQLGKALNAPIQNLSALSRSGIQFTKEQKALIKTLWETGQQAEAQTVILKELEKQYGGSAEAARDTLGGALKALSNASGDLLEDIGALGSGSLKLAAVLSTDVVGALQTVVKWTSLYRTIKESMMTGEAMSLDNQLAAANAYIHLALTEKGVAQATATRDAILAQMNETETEALIRVKERAIALRRQADAEKAATEAANAALKAVKDAEAADIARNKSITDWIQSLRDERAALDMTAREKANLTAETLRATDAQKVEIDNLIWAIDARKKRTAADQAAIGVVEALTENQEIAATGVRSYSDAIVEWASGAEVSFATVAEDFAKMVAKMLLQQALLSAFGLTTPTATTTVGGASALGNAFSSGRVVPMARGGVVTQPTLFPMARGAGLMGEAGPEAVMPLARTSRGELGVNVEGSAPVVNVSIINNTGAKVTERREQRGDSLDIDVMIGDSIANHLNRGTADRAMRDSFGVRRRSAGR